MIFISCYRNLKESYYNQVHGFSGRSSEFTTRSPDENPNHNQVPRHHGRLWRSKSGEFVTGMDWENGGECRGAHQRSILRLGREKGVASERWRRTTVGEAAMARFPGESRARPGNGRLWGLLHVLGKRWRGLVLGGEAWKRELGSGVAMEDNGAGRIVAVPALLVSLRMRRGKQGVVTRRSSVHAWGNQLAWPAAS
jgi:hypothetical protein